MKTPAYVKMDSSEQLLVSEGVCRQLGVVSYHKDVIPGTSKPETGSDGCVPTVRVMLLKNVKLKPLESVIVEVKLVGEDTETVDIGNLERPIDLETQTIDGAGSLLLLEMEPSMEMETGVQMPGTLVRTAGGGVARALLTNQSTTTEKIMEGMVIGAATPITIVDPDPVSIEATSVRVVKDVKASYSQS